MRAVRWRNSRLRPLIEQLATSLDKDARVEIQGQVNGGQPELARHTQLVGTRIEGVASRLLLLLSVRGEIDDAIKAAETLLAIEKRRVLLLLAIWVVRDRYAGAAERIAGMLPTNHAGVKWALAGAKGRLEDTALDDLGDPISVGQVLSFMQPKKKH